MKAIIDRRSPLFHKLLSMFMFEYKEKPYCLALKENKVEVAQFRPSAVVVEYDYYEDDELSYKINRYYFDIGYGHILRLECRPIIWKYTYFFPYFELDWLFFMEFEESKWPSNRFEVVQAYTRILEDRFKIWVGVFSYGNELKPIREINFENEGKLECECRAPVAVFKGSLDRLEETISKEPVDVWN
jgi:hypothetical protein